ncbi:hypothetical protein ACIGO9_29920 [Nocardia asteroides]|uniref:hypothetical protein n=1 Tax=Nocardia asteroides TaxID=1824 RepID=UPI0037CA5225
MLDTSVDAVSPLDVLRLKEGYAQFLGGPVAAEMFADIGVSGDQGIPAGPSMDLASLKQAQNYWMSSDMTTIIDTAQATMPDDDFVVAEAPAPHGFLIMARPVRLRCNESKCELQHALQGFTWRPAVRTLFGRVDEGISVAWLGPNEPELISMFGLLGAFGDPVFLPTGHPISNQTSRDAGVLNPQSEVLTRYVRASWALMDAPLADITEPAAPRPLRRRMGRDGVLSTLVAVDLKSHHRPPSEAGGEGPDWSHRWMVRGHWRHLKHPRFKNPRAVWIPEYAKGPDDKPLVVKDKVITITE